jgi:hypothetical protein
MHIMKKKAKPNNRNVLFASAKKAGREAVLKALKAGITVYGMENGVLVGRDLNNHPMTMEKSSVTDKT